MEILLLCGIYLVETVCYYLGLRILFEIRQKDSAKIWMTVGLIFPMLVKIVSLNDITLEKVFIEVGLIGVMFLSIEGSIIEKGVKLILVFLFLECIDEMFAVPCRSIFALDNNEYLKIINYLIIKFCALISIVILSVIKKRIYKNQKAHINSAVYFIIGIIVISMMFCLAVLNNMIGYFPNSNYMILCNILNTAILMSIFFLIVFVIYIKNTHEKMEQLLKTEKLLKESQVSYYKQVLKKEADTRKYRHDMVNHLVYVQGLLNEKRVDDVQRYLSSILGGFKKIQSLYYVTGNEMVDTIMNYFFGMLSKTVDIEIRGRNPVVIDMEETDVCTIFSNLFQNVVEEITENEIENARILIEIAKGRQYVEYRITNSMVSKVDILCINKNGLPKSHKVDKQNHGIGMINVKKAVEENKGKFEWHQEGKSFCVSIVLPIK